MTAALEGGEWSAARPGRTLPPGKDPVPIVHEAGWAAGSVWTRRKISSPPGFVPGPVYEIMCEKFCRTGQATNDSMTNAHCMPKAADTHSEYVMLMIFSLQQRFHGSASLLHYVYKNIACLTTGCPTCYRTRHFFNNFTTNGDIATKFEADLPHCVRNVTTS